MGLEDMPAGQDHLAPLSATLLVLQKDYGVGCLLYLKTPACLIGYTVLDILHVLPIHQNNGVGACLVNWGLGQADSEGIQCYVESSPAARYLCAKKGFHQVADMKIDLGRYKEGAQEYCHMIMIRPPYGNYESSRPSSDSSPFDDEPDVSPIDDMEEAYTAEAKMLEFRPSSSLKSTGRIDTRSSTTSSHLSSKNREQARTLVQAT